MQPIQKSSQYFIGKNNQVSFLVENQPIKRRHYFETKGTP